MPTFFSSLLARLRSTALPTAAATPFPPDPVPSRAFRSGRVRRCALCSQPALAGQLTCSAAHAALAGQLSTAAHHAQHRPHPHCI